MSGGHALRLFGVVELCDDLSLANRIGEVHEQPIDTSAHVGCHDEAASGFERAREGTSELDGAALDRRDFDRRGLSALGTQSTRHRAAQL